MLGAMTAKAFEDPKRGVLYRLVSYPPQWGIGTVRHTWAQYCVQTLNDNQMQLATEDVGYFPKDPTIYLYCYDEEDHSWAVEAADAITTDTMANIQCTSRIQNSGKRRAVHKIVTFWIYRSHVTGSLPRESRSNGDYIFDAIRMPLTRLLFKILLAA
ncbi:hypothetical protein IE81DRAFT_332095 [Ceraceosorus guamensis]|uniref:Uncharacterized protein n=1 Tax=Ceraceosorus guamensis TaxID=1522189 RepID=A0A316VR10_9BASI|nr:hypothetical protein IE81DRAFT_332095 [Ceraceosorus guamensis]PWN39780.1 hypothetical protein IE81DRAFT_332095 [Ceraceosorus guamensis]